MARPSPASRKAAAENQRRLAQAEARRRRRLAVLVGALAALALVAGVAWWTNREQEEPVTPASQVAVPHASTEGRGIVLHATPKDRPTLVIYEDYRCPWCKVAHDELGPLVEQLAAEKKFGVEVRSLELIDQMAGGDASHRATVAAACADVSGAYAAYREAVFAHQPKDEKTGFTDEQLRTGFAREAGIKDLAAFQTCYDQRRTHTAVATVLDQARLEDRDGSSPQYWVAGTDGKADAEIDLQQLMGQQRPTKAELLKAVEDAA